jgi:hypothetical protein
MVLLRWLTLAVALAAVMPFSLLIATIPSFLEVFLEFDAELAVAAGAVSALIGSQFLTSAAQFVGERSAG